MTVDFASVAMIGDFVTLGIKLAVASLCGLAFFFLAKYVILHYLVKD